MAKRYSGDAEIRIRYDARSRVYRGTVVDPWLRFSGWVPLERRYARDPQTSEAYDDAARRLARVAGHWAKRDASRDFAFDEPRGSGIRLRRVFQSPCPIG